jgi:hypothetical protein
LSAADAPGCCCCCCPHYCRVNNNCCHCPLCPSPFPTIHRSFVRQPRKCEYSEGNGVVVKLSFFKHFSTNCPCASPPSPQKCAQNHHNQNHGSRSFLKKYQWAWLGVFREEQKVEISNLIFCS